MPNTLSRAQREGRKLGFSIRVFGSPDLPSFDARSQGEGHLSVGLAFLRDILLYLEANRIRFYRMHSNLIPAALHSDLEGLKRQMEECSAQLEDLHTLIGRQDVRLTFHPYSQVTLNALNEEQAERSQRSLAAHALLLDGLGLGPEAVVVIHAGGIYDGMVPSSERFAARYQALSPSVRARVVLEQDDTLFDHAAVRGIHALCGVPLVFDNLHHRVHNRQGIPMGEALAFSLRTWPEGVTPKVHYSSPRSEMRLIEGSGRIKLPSWKEHADFCVPFELIDWMGTAQGLGPFDIMLEAKARDMALLQLRRDLQRFAPELARQFV